jgi:hypothetical protein
MKFERILQTHPPYDKRNIDPKKDYGICALQLRFILKKGEKAVQVLLYTNSYLASTIKEYKHKISSDHEGYTCFDVGYHSNTPIFKGQIKSDCDVLKGKECYYDGSSLRGRDDKIAENYLEHGDEWVWKYLEKQWKVVFGRRKND